MFNMYIFYFLSLSQLSNTDFFSLFIVAIHDSKRSMFQCSINGLATMLPINYGSDIGTESESSPFYMLLNSVLLLLGRINKKVAYIHSNYV